tara:strand:- start:822 stop:1013 length:192 start_codon:yes stop_codon:yes gene_type:complete
MKELMEKVDLARRLGETEQERDTLEFENKVLIDFICEKLNITPAQLGAKCRDAVFGAEKGGVK